MANIEDLKKEFKLDTAIKGKSLNDYLAELMEKNERLEMEIERGKLDVAFSKQMNNYSRLLLDASKHELKRREFDLKQAQNLQNA